MIIDAHVHIAPRLTGFWQPLRYGRVSDEGRALQVFAPSFDPPASPTELALAHMDHAGVDHAILVQHHLYGDQNEAVIDAVRRWPDRFSGLGYLGAVDQPDAPDRLERLMAAGLAGLKVEVSSTRRLRPGFRFGGELEWRVWERLDDLAGALVVDLSVSTPEDTAVLRRMLDAFPRLRLVVCHLGSPPADGWQERALLARHPRVWTDLAFLPGLASADPEYPFPEARELLHWGVENVGAANIMWGTDYPAALRVATYRQQIGYIARHCAFLSNSEKDLILGGAAQAFLRG